MFEKDRDQDRLKRPGPRSVDPSLHVKSCFLEEAIEKLLILLPQAPPKLLPFLDLLVQNLTERKNGPSHT
jgi:hypothetical protein